MTQPRFRPPLPGVPQTWLNQAESIVRSVRTIQQSHTTESRNPRALRDVHTKHHGLVQAHFVIESEEYFERLAGRLGVELARGVFSKAGHSYRCWIRYSSTSKVRQSDDVADGRGMAIKLIEVPDAGIPLPDGTENPQKKSQDFLLINGPAFFAKDADEMVEAAKLEAEDRFPSNFLLSRPRGLAATIAPLQAQAHSPLALTYFSQTPYALGDDLVAKYQVRPRILRHAPPAVKGKDHLREQLQIELSPIQSGETKAAPVELEFGVQLGLDNDHFPIDDATVVWDATVSPFIRLATILVFPQRFTHESRALFAERIEYNPFHSATEHRPLGSINFARGLAYVASQAFRYQANGAPPRMTYDSREWEREESSGADLTLAEAPPPDVAEASGAGSLIDTLAHIAPGFGQATLNFLQKKWAYLLVVLLFGSCSYYHWEHPSGGLGLNAARLLPSEERIPGVAWAKDYQTEHAQKGLASNAEYIFAHQPTGTEFDGGVPYWVFRALPKIAPEYFGGYPDYRIHGFDSPQDSKFIDDYHGLPRGLVLSDTTMYLLGTKVEIKLKRVSFNCATCHSGEYQDQEGKSHVVLGMPANVIDTVGFKTAFHKTVQDPRFTAARLIEAINEVFADDAKTKAGAGIPVTAPRLTTTEEFVYEQIAASIKKISLDRPLRWMNYRPENGPGRVDAFGALRFEYLRLSQDEPQEMLKNTVVDLPSVWNQRASVRPWHHWDGNTASGRARNFGAIIGVGGRPYSIHQRDMRLVGDFIDSLQAPPYPFEPRPNEETETGRTIYLDQCAKCHGEYLNRTLVAPTHCMKKPMNVGTDPERSEAITDEFISLLNEFGRQNGLWGPDSFRASAEPGAYICPPLDGIWARSPYLHNGSVPTLDALLSPAEQRPKEFYRGNTRYDTVRGGFSTDLQKGMEHRSFHFVTKEKDRKKAGNSSAGHEYTILDENERQALIAYLLTL